MERNYGTKISIHALRGEGDRLSFTKDAEGHIFLSTPSVGRATLIRHFIQFCSGIFLSTPSVGRATEVRCPSETPTEISIHALRGEGDGHLGLIAQYVVNHFYPRPPWGGRPLWEIRATSMRLAFLSTPSVGRATCSTCAACPSDPISIHALRGEGDSQFRLPIPFRKISIHALRGEGDRAVSR